MTDVAVVRGGPPAPARRRRAAAVRAAWLAAAALALASPVIAQQGPLVYAPNQAAATISVLDGASGEVVRTIDLTALGFSRDSRPHHTAVEPDGSHWYVSLIGERKVLKFDRDGRLVGQADVTWAGMLGLDPAGDRLLVSPSMTAVSAPSRIAALSRSTLEGDELEVLVPRPHALVVHPRGRWAYVASVAANQFVVLDLETEQTRVLTVDGPPNTFVQFAVSPDGRHLVVTGQLSGDLLVFDLARAEEPRLRTRVRVGAGPYHPAFSPDGRHVLVALQRDNALAVVNARTWRLARTVADTAFAQPHGVAVSSDGRWIYVSNENVAPRSGPDHPAEHGGMRHDAPAASPPGRVVVVDARRWRVARVVDTGRQTTGLSVEPRR